MHESHCIIGRIGSIKENQVSGKKVVNISIAVQRGKEQTTWWDVSLWGEQADNFLNMTVVKGTIIAANVWGVYADAYLDKAGAAKATLKGNVNSYRLLSPPKDTE